MKPKPISTHASFDWAISRLATPWRDNWFVVPSSWCKPMMVLNCVDDYECILELVTIKDSFQLKGQPSVKWKVADHRCRFFPMIVVLRVCVCFCARSTVTLGLYKLHSTTITKIDGKRLLCQLSSIGHPDDYAPMAWIITAEVSVTQQREHKRKCLSLYRHAPPRS